MGIKQGGSQTHCADYAFTSGVTQCAIQMASEPKELAAFAGLLWNQHEGLTFIAQASAQSLRLASCI